MDFDKMRESSNVEDRRGQSGGFGGTGARLGLGGLLIAVVGSLLFGLDPSTVLSGLQALPSGQVASNGPAQAVDPNDPGGIFARKTLGDLEDVWSDVFQKHLGKQYQPAKLVLFSGATDTECGTGQAAMGPFYCPPDQNVYLDLAFMNELKGTSSQNGGLARTYVIAHEIGHHVQNQLGITGKVESMRRQMNEAQGNKLSVRVELQADCFAGIWASSAIKRGIVQNEQELQTAIKTAMEIGDDYLQSQSRGYVVEEAFTHGSSQMRATWFKRGIDTGDINQCNTFARDAVVN